MDCIGSPWISGSFILSPPRPPQLPSSFTLSSSSFRLFCRSQFSAKDLKFVLHDALHFSGTDITHAKAARDCFISQIQNLSVVERETSICINRCVNLGETALYIAAEDDSLMSHSSVPLPVDAFLERLNKLSTSYCPHFRSSLASSPEDLLDSLERYLYITKGFRRTTGYLPSPKDYYLHSVLAQRCGSVAILSLIYSEVLKMLQLWGVIDFDVEIHYPHDLSSLPRAYNKKKGKESDQKHIMTSESLLVEILKNLKNTYWPFQQGHTESLFLRAANAANCINSGFEHASAKASQHRLDRGVWTSVLFGDMRRALSACERLILLEANSEELRDYAILLYHCGYYEEALQYLIFYNEAKQTSDSLDNPAEDDAVEKLIVRLNLILMEEDWKRPSGSFLRNNSEPW
ncbi:hypothetical protein BVRB_2g041640 [Beta vulgaris subsp. vulgaris]|uniref:uncharacterized protein LOC104887533 isoform X1 n=1 Tax=Beta vulgaris subsp. vulgaris TaxID=3555 RepID=UPI00053F4ACA|nr:uncharacterized protein LOC104887533 isoform X1 [Beta vulgaris subsp. vulgaris]KMT17110.1 hypothetical protein BVRB_2g041640 [Beta vulgaris subsp. vulgaris]